MELVAASWLLRRDMPDLKVRVVNVVDLMTMFTRDHHPHGMDAQSFIDLFTADKPVIFAFHGYQRAVHELVHGRPDPERFHVRGFIEEGTTTTPFDMVVRNKTSRYHFAIEALKRTRRNDEKAQQLIRQYELMLLKHDVYVREHLEDMPEVKDWVWQ